MISLLLLLSTVASMAESEEDWVSGTLRNLSPGSDEVFLDEGCWGSGFTVELCCLTSYERSLSLGCWTDPEQWTYCCRSFILWRPPESSPGLRQLYASALDFVLARRNLHEGMIFGRMAANLGYTSCVEVGVFGGTWSEFFLAFSTSVDGKLEAKATAEVREYTLVDQWFRDPRGELGDGGLETNLFQARRLQEAVKKLERFWPRVRFVQQRSTVASRLFDASSLDMVFIDAGHDECSVLEDLEAWWPKVRSGGLVAGDDYADAEAVQEMYGEHQDWSVCADGSVRPGAVLGAVDAFAAGKGLQVSVFRMIGASLSPQWLLFKP